MERPERMSSGEAMRWNEDVNRRRLEHHERRCAEDAMYLDKTPEFWAGWALAYYQWHSGRSFMDILSAVPFSEIIRMYPVYHEMDIRQFIDRMDDLMKDF